MENQRSLCRTLVVEYLNVALERNRKFLAISVMREQELGIQGLDLLKSTTPEILDLKTLQNTRELNKPLQKETYCKNTTFWGIKLQREADVD